MSRVTLAYPFTDDNGTTHDRDATIELPAEAAAELVRTGRARRPDPEPPASATPPVGRRRTGKANRKKEN